MEKRTVQCPHAEKSDTLILCDHAPEETGTFPAWRARESGKIITMPHFCLTRCAWHKAQAAEKPKT